jgi:hypothetical protein
MKQLCEKIADLGSIPEEKKLPLYVLYPQQHPRKGLIVKIKFLQISIFFSGIISMLPQLTAAQDATVYLRARVTEVNDVSGILGDAIKVAAEITGSYTFNLQSADNNP